ncbi:MULTISPECIES: hypothetical protein [Rhizobium]|uniref:DUF982 domain-containing protein n=1 Tax=Rhizobium indigoferae TaxID=158891 RepID=A0ABZ1DV80_9HYPH|nr:MULTISPECIES: hypothetical protein [Rhizobium]MBA8830774.1 hypothetical protein [Rhizobium leguminosarum]MDH6274676.1 hypothetical protein [Rhizobium leguminosarum]MVO91687.1 hypothetical protein [Rhizobium leguminosarum bv. phaseoli]NNU52239.1 hypothetical protein [Rhizobium indigoferae]TBY26139.1 hypothetical protein E0H30_00890 [Rhizobium leguminosarum bv. viciae]
MVQTIKNRSQVPLDSRDLETCQRVFDRLSADYGVARDSDEAERMASIVIELYRQGVRDPDHLQSMVEAARGIFEASERPPTAQGI